MGRLLVPGRGFKYPGLGTGPDSQSSPWMRAVIIIVAIATKSDLPSPLGWMTGCFLVFCSYRKGCSGKPQCTRHRPSSACRPRTNACRWHCPWTRYLLSIRPALGSFRRQPTRAPASRLCQRGFSPSSALVNLADDRQDLAGSLCFSLSYARPSPSSGAPWALPADILCPRFKSSAGLCLLYILESFGPLLLELPIVFQFVVFLFIGVNAGFCQVD